MLSLFLYLRMTLSALVFCICALPFYLGLLAVCAFLRRSPAIPVRRLIFRFGEFVLAGTLKGTIPVRFEDRSGDARPMERGIVVCNHRSASDPFLMAALPMARNCIQAVNRWPMRLPFFGHFARLAGYLDITRMTYEEIRRRTADCVASGGVVIAFPEGTRSGSRRMGQFHSAFFRVAHDLTCPIFPVAIAVNERAPDRRFRFCAGRILMRRLPAIPGETAARWSHRRLQNETRSLLLRETEQMDKELQT